MQFNIPKNDPKYHWTNHVVRKMMHYGLSADRVKRVMRNPTRSEKGIAPDTIAVMQPAGSKAKPTEVWVMYATKKTRASKDKVANLIGPKKVVITAWRYPGISKVRDEIPIPADILAELKNIKY
jgi:hypothetical protein